MYALVRLVVEPDGTAESTAEEIARGDARAVFEAAARLCSEAELNAARLHYLPRELRSRVKDERAAEMDEYRKN